jgi:hypothetical protein
LGYDFREGQVLSVARLKEITREGATPWISPVEPR